MEMLQDFAEWAWLRHHNLLSWYIRPLFLIPFCYAAWRRSLTGIAVTLLALATSMFWFPAPAHPDPRVAEFLDVEREYLLENGDPQSFFSRQWRLCFSLRLPSRFGAVRFGRVSP